MSLLNEAQENITLEREYAKGILPGEPVVDEQEFEPETGGGFEIPFPDLSLLKAKTGPGGIDDYLDHPLNANQSRATARIIRGITGMLGESNFAVADILIGAVELNKERTSRHVESM